MTDLREMSIWSRLRLFTHPGTRLSQRVAFAGAWQLALQVVGRGLTTVRLIILARLLTPEAFGLVAIALLVTDLLTTFTQLGFNTALIQRRGDIRDYLDTAWVMSAIRGLVLGGLIFGIAPLAAGYFNAPDAKPIVQAMAAVLVFNGFFNIGTIYFYKELELHKRFVWETGGTVADLAVSISAALLLRNAWALVYGVIAASIVRMIMSYVMHPYRPRLRLDLQKAKELFGFGWWVLLTSMVNYVFTNVDTIFVGRLLGVVSLGLYGMSHRIGDQIGREVGLLTTNVAFPAYSMLQNNLARLRQAFSTTIEAISLVVFPIAAGVFILAPDFVTIVLGEQWGPAIPAMRILAIAAAMYPLLRLRVSLFYAIGKPRLTFLVTAAATFIMVVLLLPLSRGLGLTGAAIAVLAGNVSGLLLLTWTSVRVLDCGVKDLARPLVSPCVVSLLLSITLVVAKHAVGQVGLREFIFILCLGALVYAASALLLWKFFRSGPVQILTVLRGRN